MQTQHPATGSTQAPTDNWSIDDIVSSAMARLDKAEPPALHIVYVDINRADYRSTKLFDIEQQLKADGRSVATVPSGAMKYCELVNLLMCASKLNLVVLSDDYGPERAQQLKRIKRNLRNSPNLKHSVTVFALREVQHA